MENNSTFDLKSWMIGFAFGLAGKHMPVSKVQKEPVTVALSIEPTSMTIGWLVGKSIGKQKRRVTKHYDIGPVLAPSNTWYKGATARSTLTSINIVDTYVPTGEETESWAADVDDSGSIMCYVCGTELYLVGNGSGRIVANENSRGLFGEGTETERFINVTTINGIELLNTSNVVDMSFMFNYCQSLSSLDLRNFNTSNVTDMSSMFQRCHSLETINLSNFNTSNVVDMSYMFTYCQSVTSLDLRNFNTSNVTNMRFMFNRCENMTSLQWCNFDTSKVTNMNAMFQYCVKIKELNLSSFNTRKVTNMGFMFNHCESLITLDLNNFNTSKVTTIGAMFQSCYALETINISNFDTINVTDMGYVFYGCQKLKRIDLIRFNTINATTMYCLFYNCAKVTKIYVGAKWTTKNVTSTGYMFSKCGVSGVTYI